MKPTGKHQKKKSHELALLSHILSHVFSQKVIDNMSVSSSQQLVKTLATRVASSSSQGTLQELRFLISPSTPESQGLRQFIESSYLELKKANPLFPLLVREDLGNVKASIVARFGQGVEKKVSVEDLKEKEVAEALERLIM